MEFVDGPDLRNFLSVAPRPFSVPQALEITRGICEGLRAAHARGMVHRDIKPENILLAREREGYVPKIADFGIVATRECSTSHTRTGATLLTMAYAAPEQWRGMAAAELDGRTDLYALGGVLFEMLIGQTVFTAESYEGWSGQHLNTAPVKPGSMRPDLAAWRGLDDLVVRLLAKERSERPNDADEVLRLLDMVRYVAPEPHQRTVTDYRVRPPRSNSPGPEVSCGGFRRGLVAF
jgi:serine/threonine-protein kinase